MLSSCSCRITSVSFSNFTSMLKISGERTGFFDSTNEEYGDGCGFLLLLFGGNDLNHFNTLHLDLCHTSGEMMLYYAKRSGR